LFYTSFIVKKNCLFLTQDQCHLSHFLSFFDVGEGVHFDSKHEREWVVHLGSTGRTERVKRRKKINYNTPRNENDMQVGREKNDNLLRN
jgi:hypothetical protein